MHHTARQHEPAADHLQFAKCFIVTIMYIMYIQNNALNAPSICALSIKTDKLKDTKYSVFKSRIILAAVTVHHVAVGLSRENVIQQFLMNVDLSLGRWTWYISMRLTDGFQQPATNERRGTDQTFPAIGPRLFASGTAQWLYCRGPKSREKDAPVLLCTGGTTYYRHSGSCLARFLTLKARSIACLAKFKKKLVECS